MLILRKIIFDDVWTEFKILYLVSNRTKIIKSSSLVNTTSFSVSCLASINHQLYLCVGYNLVKNLSNGLLVIRRFVFPSISGGLLSTGRNRAFRRVHDRPQHAPQHLLPVVRTARPRARSCHSIANLRSSRGAKSDPSKISWSRNLSSYVSLAFGACSYDVAANDVSVLEFNIFI